MLSIYFCSERQQRAFNTLLHKALNVSGNFWDNGKLFKVLGLEEWMDNDIKLTKNELLVLKICDEKPGNIERIKKELIGKLSKKKIKEILSKLSENKFVYNNQGKWDINPSEGIRKLSEELDKKNTSPNYWGERIKRDFIQKIALKLQNLSKEQIDELWAKTGWKDLEKGKNKSLPDWRLEKIKNNKSWARQSLTNLFLECPKKEFVKIFSGI